jgi:pimeloyl-ACP methyl ester carboxylesterase
VYRTEVTPPGGSPVVLHAEDKGEGPPILLLHGLGASTFTWRYIVPDLARTHRVIALDMKGFGRSEKPLDLAYSAEDQAALVAAFVRKRELSGLTVVGHSFGGAVAVRTALLLASEPGRIARLVIMDSPVLPGSLPRGYEFILVPGAPEALIAPLPPDLIARKLLIGARGTSRGIREADVKGYAEPYYESSAKHAFLVTARAIVGDKDESLAERLRTLDVPALLVWCRSDDIVPISAGRRLAKLIRGARLEMLKGCNHLPQEQKAGAVVKLIRNFASR